MRASLIDRPGSQYAVALLMGDEHYRSWAELLYSVRTGQPAFDHVYGQPIFDHLSAHPEQARIFDAAMAYQSEGVPLVGIAGREYGSGSSRDWAAKGTSLLGIRAVIAESYERIHRSNLVGMGVLPLQFKDGDNRQSLRLTGLETFGVAGISAGLRPGQTLNVHGRRADGSEFAFDVTCRIDTPIEIEYYRHGGILPYVLRQILGMA